MLRRMTTNTTDPTSRTSELTRILTDRQRTLRAAIDERLHGGRTDRSNEVRDMVDLCDVGIEEELTFTLAQMERDTLAQVDTALARLEEGKYGACFECGAEISAIRLRAKPFAVRCVDCEVLHEQDTTRRTQHGQRIGNLPLFPETLIA